MPQGISEYTRRSEALLLAAEDFRNSLQADEGDRDVAVDELLGAARRGSSLDAVLRFEPGGPSPVRVEPGVPPPPVDPQHVLSAALFELQSANILISADLALKGAGTSNGVRLFDEARQQMSASHDELTGPIVLNYAPPSNVASGTLDSARQSFENNSGQVLTAIIDGCADAAGDALAGLKTLDPTKVLDALGRIGESVPMAAEAGRLVRAGIEKLKNAIEAIAALFGKDKLAAIKEKIEKIWENFTSGKYSRDIIRVLLSVSEVEEHIKEKLAEANKVDAVDRASNRLAPLTTNFDFYVKLLRGLIQGISFAATALSFFHFTAAWLSLAFGLAFLSTIGGAVLIGSEYVGRHRLLHWTDGVDQIADTIT